ncbi:MAG TPA: uracil-DNA glycosylase [Acidobacteriaceae bacterium]|nr:uracil-DNA glycosylase [Acidobacteriaceae bacterium]
MPCSSPENTSGGSLSGSADVPLLGNARNATSAKETAFRVLESRIVSCDLCPRLRTYCAEIARTRRRAYRDWEYWGKPVPSFGDPEARELSLGLAPGAHGSNRTGRPFTGDGSGNFLYPVLHAAGFASQPLAASRDDGMRLYDLRITSVVRCAPPANKPLPIELQNCASFVDEEIDLLPQLRVVVCLGKTAFDGYVAHLLRTRKIGRRGELVFAHGAEYSLPGQPHILATYHPSLQNTNTGLLTSSMLQDVFEHARTLAAHPVSANHEGLHRS